MCQVVASRADIYMIHIYQMINSHYLWAIIITRYQYFQGAHDRKSENCANLLKMQGLKQWQPEATRFYGGLAGRRNHLARWATRARIDGQIHSIVEKIRKEQQSAVHICRNHSLPSSVSFPNRRTLRDCGYGSFIRSIVENVLTSTGIDILIAYSTSSYACCFNCSNFTD